MLVTSVFHDKWSQWNHEDDISSLLLPQKTFLSNIFNASFSFKFQHTCKTCFNFFSPCFCHSLPLSELKITIKVNTKLPNGFVKRLRAQQIRKTAGLNATRDHQIWFVPELNEVERLEDVYKSEGTAPRINLEFGCNGEGTIPASTADRTAAVPIVT